MTISPRQAYLYSLKMEEAGSSAKLPTAQIHTEASSKGSPDINITVGLGIL